MNLKIFVALASFIATVLSVDAQNIFFVSQTGNDNNDGRSWTSAKRELQAAIDAASPGDQIWVASGTYYPTRSISGMEDDARGKAFLLKKELRMFGGFAGTETDPSQRERADSSRVDFNGPWNFKYPTLLSADYDDGADSWWGSERNGQWGVAYTSGNGYHVIWNEFEDKNIAVGVVIDGFIISGGNADHGEIAAHRQAGGIFGGKGWTVRNCIIRENSAYDYGGMVNEGTLTDSYICRNRALQSGGALYNTADGKVRGCVISGNSAQFDSGGIENYGMLENCSVNGNFANFDGGAVCNYGTAANCLFFSNSANGNGGGVYNYGILVNCTVSRNSASYAGGGIVNHADGKAVNCIVWNNGTGGSGEFGYTAFTDTVIGGDGNMEISLSTVHFVIPSSFAGMAASPDNTARLAGTDWRLVKGSECIDAATAVYPLVVIPERDMNGLARPWGGAYDMGAYEYDGTTVNDVETAGEELPYAIYPNPFTSFLNIGSLKTTDRTIGIYSLTGSLVVRHPVTESTVIFNTSEWAAGSYIIKIEGEDGIYTRKVIKRP